MAKKMAAIRGGAAMPGQHGGQGGAQTVDRALGLLRLIAAGPAEGLRLSDMAAQAGLDPATAHRLMTSLVRNGFADQAAATRRYTLGLKVYSLAAAASNRHDPVAVARAALLRLSGATGDTATLCLRSGLDLVCVDVQVLQRNGPRFAPMPGQDMARVMEAVASWDWR